MSGNWLTPGWRGWEAVEPMEPDRDTIRRRYLDCVFAHMRGPRRAAIAGRALAVVDMWERSGAHPHYIERWRALLSGEVEDMREAVMTDRPEAEALRHCMPFAGVLTNAERAELRLPREP
jgi:hypothetical protein